MGVYTSTRIFKSPFLRRTQTVRGVGAVFGALLGGPIYYWKKQAPIEALALFTLQLIVFLLSVRDAPQGGADMETLSIALWLGAALLAPVLLPLCYLRKGWIEVGSI